MRKLLIVTGPTATGKTALGIELARKFNGEIISADSRQIYKGNDVETGKDRSFPQWGIDIAKPGDDFNVSAFVAYAQKIISDITARGKLPIVIGGTGQYIKELLNPSATLNVPLNPQLRAKLEKLSIDQLQKELAQMQPDKWKSMNQSDRNNPRRLVRAIEVARQDTRHPSTSLRASKVQDINTLDSLVIGLVGPRQILYNKIVERRKNRPDLVEKEFKLAKKQLLYMQKFLKPVWSDISKPNYRNKIFSAVSKWYTSTNGGKEN